jgi:hypothetical protein
MCVPVEHEVAAGERQLFYRVAISKLTPYFLWQERRATQEVQRIAQCTCQPPPPPPPPTHRTPPRYDDDRERERERRAVELDDRGANARRQELRRLDKEDEEAEASEQLP